jgi:hypothetical protein
MDHVYRKDRAVVSPQTIQKFCQEIAISLSEIRRFQTLFQKLTRLIAK